MNLRRVLPALAAGVAIGVLIFLLRMTQSVDSDLHLERLANIRTINGLDVQLNRVMTQARVASLQQEGDDRSKVTAQLGDALDALEKGPKSIHGLTPALDKALDTFLETVQAKFELDFDIEARNTILNQRLVNSVNSVEGNVNALVAAATPSVHAQVHDLGDQLKTQLVIYGVTPSPTNQKDVEVLSAQLDKFGPKQPQAFKDALARLHTTAQDVVTDKNELVTKLEDFLDRPTGPQLQAVEQIYSSWYAGQVAVASAYRLALVIYAAVLLAVLAWLGLRLRSSYRDLDRANASLTVANETLEAQVEARTHDLSAALTDLRASQAQLVQSEKMASLGQMVAGVAHEINTPLGYARSNTEIVRNSLAEVRSLCAAQDKPWA